MVKELFDKNIFVYIMLGLCVCGVLLKFVLDIVYSRLIKASDNMGTAKNKLTQMMKKKFETCYKLKIGVNNVDIFVDKYVYRHKFGGILLSTWENIGGQILMLCLLIGSISAVLGLLNECGKQQILSTFSVGILTSGLLIFLEGMMNLSGKRELIKLNMKDYLENFFKVRLEQEFFHPELLEQYKKEFLKQDGVEQVTDNQALIAVTTTANQKQPAVKAEKRMAKKQNKEANRLEKEHKKLEAKQAKERIKVDKRLAIVKKQKEMELIKMEARQEEERIKKETKLALESKRAAERAEFERKKAEVKADEIHKREEKVRQEEIRKALLLEKQIVKEEKQKKTVEHKTIAQERKENLKREVQQRRSMEVLDPMHELEPLKIELDKIPAEVMEVRSEDEKIIESSKEIAKSQVKPLHIKTPKQSDSSDEKLIEDILKEFLA